MFSEYRSVYSPATTNWRILLLAAALVANFPGPTLIAQSGPVAKPAPADTPTRYQPSRMSVHAVAYYGTVWGIDSITVKTAESGELIRFSYRVVNPEKATPLNDKTNTPFLISPVAGLRLSVPSLEKVGQLRQSNKPEEGKYYWMAFSNPGRRVKHGDRVDVEIGPFRADGLVVE